MQKPLIKPLIKTFSSDQFIFKHYLKLLYSLFIFLWVKYKKKEIVRWLLSKEDYLLLLCKLVTGSISWQIYETFCIKKIILHLHFQNWNFFNAIIQQTKVNTEKTYIFINFHLWEAGRSISHRWKSMKM